jgi:glucose/arabinose dehydrogenase
MQVGLRNPWRFSFDPATGDLYIGEVGQDRWEEIDVVPAGALRGANLGWSQMEGAHCYRKGCAPGPLPGPGRSSTTTRPAAR